MTLFEQILAAFPEFEDPIVWKESGIHLQNDEDGFGDYIAKWDYSKPIPKGMKVGKGK